MAAYTLLEMLLLMLFTLNHEGFCSPDVKTQGYRSQRSTHV